MISFVNDYSQTACPEILDALRETYLECNPGYLSDTHTEHAVELIRKKVGKPDAAVHFLMGGTQTNMVVFCAFLRPHEAVITVDTGHINVHETGAVEGTGHKCLIARGCDGKVTVDDIEDACAHKHWDHAGILTVKPRLVYISQSTETGTVYSAAELRALRKACDKYGLILYCDGARLASALDCSDASWEVMAETCDAFYIGGTKNGAMFGEALVITNDALKPDFGYIAKQRGGVLAKGWILGIQFEVLMQDNLFERIGTHMNEMAMHLRGGLEKLAVEFTVDSVSNQQFVVINDDVLKSLENDYAWEVISKPKEGKTEIRLVTGWATKKEEIDSFLESLKAELDRR